MPEWHKIVFTRDQIADGEYERLHERISVATIRDPRKFGAVAIYSPRLACQEKYDDLGSTITKFFSPDAVWHFADLLRPYHPVACPRPPREDLSAVLTTMVDHELWQD